jgi:RNA polymerase sigma-54 factor
MRQGVDLVATMSQGLVMTPRLQQAIKLLQFNHQEMLDHIDEVLLENPTLEATPSESTYDEGLARVQSEASASESSAGSGDGEGAAAESGVDWERFLDQMADRPRGTEMAGGSSLDDLPPIETNLTYGESLAEHLGFQLHMLRCAEGERRVAEQVVNNLDERGWLEVPLTQLADELGVSAEVAQDGLELVWELDPPGCGARSLSECLAIQARFYFPEDDTFPKLVSEECLHHLERRNYPAIAKLLALDVEDVIEYHRMMQDQFEPYPGRAFTGEDARYITPDIYLEKTGDGWAISLNEDGMPELKVSAYYQKIFRTAKKADREYLLDKLRGAEFLIKSIHKRRQTIRKVMESLLTHQRDFFELGRGHLRPLVLQDVADDVGVHMSTVSRATTNKYVHTPHGIFELKYFFSAAVPQQGGGELAAEAIQTRIQAMIAAEDPKKPLSDQQIADTLSKKDGIAVARRTVAKYREILGILPSSHRKQLF